MKQSSGRFPIILKTIFVGSMIFVLAVFVYAAYSRNLASHRGVEGRTVSHEEPSLEVDQRDADVSSNFPVPQNSESEPARILFGGDMMFDRQIRLVAQKQGYDFLFSGVKEVLSPADVVVANLEGPITSQPSKSVGSKMGEPRNYLFTFDPEVAPMLKRNNIGVVNLGNNHILNFGKEGLAETRKYLEDAGVEYFGDPLNISHRWLLKEVKGVKIAFVNYNQFAAGGREAVFEDLQQARPSADVVIVYTHWGNEYVPANDAQKRLAHAFIDAGADVVIGSHPHVVQESEEYKGKKIYYSLGNFVFDQYFSKETRRGLLVEMTIDSETQELSFRELPILLHPSGEVKFSRDL